MKLSVLVAYFCFLPLISFCQDESWGVGIINGIYESNGDYVEKCSVHILNAPGGHPVGYLSYEKVDHYSERFVWESSAGESLSISQDNLRETSYEKSSLLVFAEQDGFVRIIGADEKEQYWVSIDELEEGGLIYQSWLTFMTTNDRSFLTFKYKMNCRSAPSVDAKKLLTVSGHNFEIAPTGEVEGLWAKVDVKEYNSDYCEGAHQLVYTYHGWMKILDDAGYPNVWFFTRGC